MTVNSGGCLGGRSSQVIDCTSESLLSSTAIAMENDIMTLQESISAPQGSQFVLCPKTLPNQLLSLASSHAY